MATEQETDRYYLEIEHIPDDGDSDLAYDDGLLDTDFLSPDMEEDLDSAVRTSQEAYEDLSACELPMSQAKKKVPGSREELSRRPEVVDDFVRNFLVKMGMGRTLDCFQTEWYEMLQEGLLQEEAVGVVPDVYTQNHGLDQEVKKLREEVNKYKKASAKARETYVKLRKERDHHRMHHKRVVHEKNKLISDIKRIQKHYMTYEPTVHQLKQKYEAAMKEKMLTKLERDRAVGQVAGLQSTIKNIEGIRISTAKSPQVSSGLTSVMRGSANVLVDERGHGPTQRALLAERKKYRNCQRPVTNIDTPFPVDTGVNPILSQVKDAPNYLSRSAGLQLANTFKAHSQAVSSVALHPLKDVLVTTSDDHTWKMWSVPNGDIIMTGEGHTDWLSDAKFHPSGHKLATTSGDTTVKIWDFSRAECVQTFGEHTHSVWSCSWHSCGDFLATASMDNTSKIWDMNSQRCRYTLRGHADSVNAIQFLPYSNTLVTCSADKTISLWDARIGLCAQTFYGHMNSINDVTFNLRGDTIASCDSYGSLKMWDVRAVSPMVSVDCGPHPANKVAFDSSGMILALASNDGAVKMYTVASGQLTDCLGHEDAVQSVIFGLNGEYMVSGGSDQTVRVWS